MAKKVQDTSPLALGRQQKNSAANKKQKKDEEKKAVAKSTPQSSSVNKKAQNSTFMGGGYNTKKKSTSSSTAKKAADNANERAQSSTFMGGTKRPRVAATSREMMEQRKASQAANNKQRIQDTIKRDDITRAAVKQAGNKVTDYGTSYAKEQERIANKKRSDISAFRQTDTGKTIEGELKRTVGGHLKSLGDDGNELSMYKDMLDNGVANGKFTQAEADRAYESFKNSSKRFSRYEGWENTKSHEISQKIFKKGQEIYDEGEQQVNSAMEGAGKLKKAYLGALSSGVGMATDMLAGPAWMVSMLSRTYGGEIGRAEKEGATKQEDRNFAGLQALKEVGTEGMFAGIGLAGAMTRGKGLFDAFAGRLTGRVAESGILSALRRYGMGIAEENLEEVAGWALDPAIKNFAYGNALWERQSRQSTRDEGEELRQTIASMDEDSVRAIAAHLNSDAYLDQISDEMMANGATKEEASKMAVAMQGYMNAILSNDKEGEKEYEDLMVSMLKGSNPYKEKLSPSELLETLASTTLLTGVTGIGGAITTAAQGNAIKEANGLDFVKGMADQIKLYDTDNSSQGQAISDHIAEGKDVAGTQVAEIANQFRNVEAERNERYEVSNQTKDTLMKREDLRVQPRQQNPDGTYSLGEVTDRAYDEHVKEAIDFMEKSGMDIPQEDMEQIADAYGAYMTGVINPDQMAVINTDNAAARTVFAELGDINFNDYAVRDNKGVIDTARTNVETENALYAIAADNYVGYARLEQANWNDEARGAVGTQLASGLGTNADIAIQHALNTVDPRDKGKFMLTGQAARRVYEYARNTNDTWDEVRSEFRGMYKGVDDTALKFAFNAAKEDKTVAETKYYGKAVKEDSNGKSSLTDEQAYVPGEFKNESKRLLKGTEISTLSSVAKDLGINVIMTDSLEQNENGSYLPKKRTIMLNAANTMEQNLQAIFSHEITHHLAAYATDEYLKLSRLVMDKWYKADPEGFNSRIEQIQALYKSAKGQELSREKALEELIADESNTFWTDGDIIDTITKEEPSLAESIINAIKDFLRKLRALVASGTITDEVTREGLFAEIDAWDQAYKLWLDAYDAASTQKANDAINEWQDRANNPIAYGVEQGTVSAGFGEELTSYSIREEDPPKNTIKAYKVFVAFKSKPGELYPPMVASPGGMPTPVGRWINADTGELARNKDGSLVTTKKGRVKVQEGGKGTNKGKGGSLAWRPGWHLGSYPDAKQFAVKDPETGEARTAFPPNFIWAECEIAADVDYQLEALSYGVTEKGKFDRTQAGLPYIPRDGYYKYRTNADPKTVPWLITGAMKVNRILDDEEAREICAQFGATPMKRAGGDINLSEYGFGKGEVTPTSDEELSKLPPAVDYSDEIRNLPGYVQREVNFDDPQIQKELAMNGQDAAYYRDLYEERNRQAESEDIRYSVSEPSNWEKGIFGLTGEPISQEYKDAVAYLENGGKLGEGGFDAAWYNSLPEVIEARKHIGNAEETINDNSPERIKLREGWVQDLMNYGSARDGIVDGKRKTIYDGIVRQDRRIDLIVGLPSSGKSSALVDPISFKYKSRLLDSDEAKKLIPEFDDGWGAGRVHEESSQLLTDAFVLSLENGDNIVMPILGKSVNSIEKRIKAARQFGYDVYVRMCDLPANKAAARNLIRFINTGRFVDLEQTSLAALNGPAESFDAVVKKGEIDGYTEVSNDVERGQNPKLVRGEEDISYNWRDSGQGREGVLGEVRSTDEGETSGQSEVRYSLSSISEAAGLTFSKQNGATVLKDAKGNVVNEVTPAYLKKTPIGRLLTLSNAANIMTDTAVDNRLEFLSKLYNMILKTQDIDLIWAVSGTLGYDPTHLVDENTPQNKIKEQKSKFASITGNSDPQYKSTIDFTTICVKTQAIIDAMSALMKKLNRGLTEHEIIDIVYNETHMAGEQVPCPVCYVFSRWVGLGNLFSKIQEFQEKYPEGADMSLIAEEYDKLQAEVGEMADSLGIRGGKARDILYRQTLERKNQLDELAYYDKISDEEKKELELIDRRLEVLDHWSWLGKTRLDPKYKEVPADILFDINAGREFATQYPAVWKFRTTRGPSLGKAAAPYTPSRLGDTIRGIASPGALKDIGMGSRPFLAKNLSKTARNMYAKAVLNAQRQNRMNGQRLQSTSDFRFEYGLDYILSFMELEAIGAKAQMYTKVPEAVKFLASTMAEVNCSIMPLGRGVDKDGNLVFSDVTGMSWADALALSKAYDNVQPILVAIGPEHLIAAMADKDITMIIPYHSSGSSEGRYVSMMKTVGEAVENRTDFAEYEGEHEIEDATPEQVLARNLRIDILTGKKEILKPAEQKILENNEILRQLYIRIYGMDEKGNEAKPDSRYVENYDENGNDADCYGVYLTKDQAKVMMPYEYWDKTSTIKDADKQGKAYQEYCKSLGLTPVFSGWDSKGKYHENMDFSDKPGYWKTLIDRCMYNNDGTYHKQNAINLDNVDLDMLDSEMMREEVVKPLQVNDPAKTEEIVNNALARIEAEQPRYSISAELDKEYDKALSPVDWDKAQELVNKAADMAGFSLKVFHGTRAEEEFTKFIKPKDNDARYDGGTGFVYVTTDESYAEIYAANGDWFEPEGFVMEGFINPDNFVNIGVIDHVAFEDDEVGLSRTPDFNDEETINRRASQDLRGVAKALNMTPYELVHAIGWRVYSDLGFYENTYDLVNRPEFAQIIRDKGYQGIKMTEFGSEAYGLLDITQFKSSDAITYDDDGSIIPLSQRFDPSNEDIRYSLPTQDSKGKVLSDGQMEYFKNSQARDKEGKLVPVFHTTKRGGFSVFDPLHSNDERSFFFTSSFAMSQTYADDAAQPIDLSQADKRPFSFPYEFANYAAEHLTGLGWNPSKNFWENTEYVRGESEDTAKIPNPETGLWETVRGRYQPDIINEANKMYGRTAPDQRGYYECYLNLMNPLIVDAEGNSWNTIKYAGDFYNTREIAQLAYSKGCDGVIIRNVVDYGTWAQTLEPADVYIAFSSNQIKDINNENPTENPDIRYSLTPEDDALEWLASQYELEDVPLDDEAAEEGRVRMAKSKREFVQSKKALWNQKWLTEGKILDVKSVEKDIRQLIMGVRMNSNTDHQYKKDLVDKTVIDAKSAYWMMKEGKYSEAAELLWDSARNIVENAEFFDDTNFKNYKTLRDYMRNTSFRLGEEYWSDVNFREFRKRNFGRIKLVKGETNIDEIYQELQERWPEWFDEDEQMTAPDQLLHLEEVLDAIKPYRIAYSSEEAEALAGDVADALYDIVYQGEEYKSLADTYKERYDAKTKALKERHQEALNKVKEKGDLRVLKEKAKFKEYKEKKKNAKERAKHFGKISDNIDWLTTRLINETKDKNIPEGFRRSLAHLLMQFDMQTERSKALEEKYGPAKKTIQMRELKSRLEKIAKEDDTGEFRYDGYLFYLMDALAEKVDGKVIDSLDTEDLIVIDTMLKAIVHNFRNYNKVRLEEENVAVANIGGNTINAMKERIAKYGKRKTYGGARGLLDKLVNEGEETAIYLFERLDPTGQGIGAMYKELRRGEDQHIRNMDFLRKRFQAMFGEYFNEKKPGSELESWRDSSQAQTFNLKYGTITLNPAQIMSLYCLSKRTQAMGHILGNGIVASPITFGAKMQEKLKGKDEQVNSVMITYPEIQEIITTLTPEQMKLADEMQSLMNNEMAAWGNETSLELHGIKLFREQNYFPIKSSSEALAKTADSFDVQEKIKNFGFTKPLVRNANNAIMIDDIFSVVADHCNKMSLYNSMAIPISDFMRVYNYKQKNEDGSVETVQQLIGEAFTRKVNDYIMKFISDVNGNTKTRSDAVDALMNKALANYKKAAIGFNARVALQQPTAIFRSLMVLDPKYFAGIKPISKEAMQEMFEHCPIALWKSWGHYDMDMGRDIEDIMMNNDWSKMDSALMGAYGALDNWAWHLIWQAVKNEVKEKNPGVKEGSQEFWDLCNERASEVYDKTQVVDSIFHRSDIMRSKNTLTKMATSFMAEPTLTYNVFRDSLAKARDLHMDGKNAEAGKILAKMMGVLALNALAVSASAALWDAVRGKGGDDDPDDENLLERGLMALVKKLGGTDPWEKEDKNAKDLWLINFLNNFVENAPWAQWNNVYFVKDVISLKDGYGTSNMALEGWETLFKGLTQAKKKLTEGSDKSWYDIFMNMLGGLGYVTGYPVKTFMRDAKAIFEKFGIKVFAADGSEGEEKMSLLDRYAEKKGYRKKSATSKEESASPSTIEKDLDKLNKKAAEKAKGLSGVQRNSMLWDVVSSGYTKYLDAGDFGSIDDLRNIFVENGGDAKWFDDKIVNACKTSYKKTIVNDEENSDGILGILRQESMKEYMLQHGVTEAEISNICYDSDTARDLKAALRIGNGEYIIHELTTLVGAGLTYQDFMRLYENRNRGAKDYHGKYTDPKYTKTTGTFVWPTEGVITSKFGYRTAPTAGASTNHPSIDIGAPQGTPVKASDGGTVIYAGWNSGYGNSVGVKHANGMVTYYNHLYAYNVKVGDQVGQGQQVGQVGSTGISTGPHLDFKILDADGNPVNPEEYLH